MFTIECKVVIKLLKIWSNLFAIVSLYDLILTKLHSESNVGVQLRNEPLKTHLPHAHVIPKTWAISLNLHLNPH
jgi:hypothetical protein